MKKLLITLGLVGVIFSGCTESKSGDTEATDSTKVDSTVVDTTK